MKSVGALILFAFLSLGAGPTAQRVDVNVGESKTITLRSTADKINVAAGGLVDLFLVDPRSLSIRGLKPGATFLVIDYDEGAIETVAVVVSVAAQTPAETLAAAMRTSLQSVDGLTITTRDDKVVIGGTTDPRNAGYYRQVTALFADRIVDSVRFAEAPRSRPATATAPVSAAYPPRAEALDFGRGAPAPKAVPTPIPPSVQIEVEVAEVNVKRARDLGVRWFSGGAWVVSGQGAVDQTGTLTGMATLDNVKFELIALVDRGVARLLTTPKLIVQSGKRASLVVGGEIPIVQTTALSSSVEYKKFGTQLEISPVVQGNGQIAVTLKATISEPDFNNRIVDYPTLNSREAQTELVIEDGRTFAVAGLLSRQEDRSRSGLPILGDIPGLGLLFGTQNSRTEEVETVVFVTPRILRPGSAPGIAAGPAVEQARSSMRGALQTNEVPALVPSPPPQSSSTGHWWDLQ